MGTSSLAPCLASFVTAVDSILRETSDEGAVGSRVMAQMAQLLREPALLTEAQRTGDSACYTRHLLYADPEGRFTALALVWQPGQVSPIHGHTAWCAVGVYEGEATETAYELPTDLPADAPEGQGTPVIARETQHAPGSVLLSRTGVHGIHRIANLGTSDLLSIHVYGSDLREDPGCINVLYEDVLYEEDVCEPVTRGVDDAPTS